MFQKMPKVSTLRQDINTDIARIFKSILLTASEFSLSKDFIRETAAGVWKEKKNKQS